MDRQAAQPLQVSQQSQRFSEVLEPILATLQGDGYDSSVRVDDSSQTVSVKIDATPNACAECLVPEDVLRQILLDALNSAAPEGNVYSLQITMPAADA